jgi:hypothetical protein
MPLGQRDLTEVGWGDDMDRLPREKRWSSSGNGGLLVQYGSGVLDGKVWPKRDWMRRDGIERVLGVGGTHIFV